MHKFSLSLLGLPLVLALPPAALATVEPESWLLEQIRLGEAGYRDNLVEESLHRLALIAPDHPQVMAARLRLALRQDDPQLARHQLERLARVAPDSAEYRQAQGAMLLTTEAGRQQLQQARLLAAAGRLTDARQAYLELFGEDFPSLDLAVEYWRLVARLPGQRGPAISRLKALDDSYPGNRTLRGVLVGLLFDAERPGQGFALLRQMAGDPATRDQAVELWLDHIRRMPVGEQSLAQLRQLVEFSEGNTGGQAGELLRQQQDLLADPAFQARTRGLALVAQGQGAAAIPWLRRALAGYPDDAGLLGALGQAYGREGQRSQAIPLLERALRADPDSSERSKWQSLLRSNRYWLLIQQGDQALQARQLVSARRHYQQARQLDDGDSYALLGLGEVALARGQADQAERYFRQALSRDPVNGGALRGLFALYRQQSPAQALGYLERLPRRQRQALGDGEPRLSSELLQQRAETLEQGRQWRAAAETLVRARQLTPDDVWLTYRLAANWRQAGRPELADKAFAELASRRPDDPEQLYAHALYLSSGGRERAALAHMDTLPRARWSTEMDELARRLEQDRMLAEARSLRDQGDNGGALAILQAQPADTRISLILADWALEDGDPGRALAGYRQVLAREPENDEARLGKIEALIADGNLDQARRQLFKRRPDNEQQTPSLNSRRRVANAWAAVGEQLQAERLFRQARQQAQQLPPSGENAWLLRDSARLARQLGQSQQALGDYGQAMAASGLTDQPPTENDDFTRLTRVKLDDDWLTRSVRADAADLYRQMDTTVTFDHDYLRSGGSGGYSDLSAHTGMLELETPMFGGRGFLRTDMVRLDAGRFDDGVYKETFGTCREVGCSDDHRQSATGASVGVGWRDQRWQGDLGTTPLGFEVVDWVGGLDYSGAWRDIGWTLTASRRPLASSLLSFGGTQDPNTGIRWGGVRATGVSLSGSYDQGRAHGLWGDIGASLLTGENVEENRRTRLMGGYYYKLVNQPQRRVSVGLNSMWWQYQKDLSGYSLGQGGYYSPQQYLSLAVPVNYRERTDDWSWELGGSVSWSRAVTDDQPRYPHPGLIPAGLPDADAIEGGDSSSGFGYTLRALVERRLNAHWTLGAGIDIQQARDFTPSHGLLYLRYSLGGWQGDLELPPQPLTPYAEFK
ncbi:cellulose synthase complex outer membrane protein BcsC [Zobellella maritima]|uniref:cellulose synthase complex outer membrane protein BcsC n=1 Tax=Zobellella maritima TaxID=2059725 RepID=UPI000E304FB6|nr:cellulose synthase complex outer membrane protein BcsC [Zobellella maritima]